MSDAPPSPESILRSNGCQARTLSVSDQHASILLLTADRETKSLLKLTVNPAHRTVLSVETEQADNAASSKQILSYLSTMDFSLLSESGAEYSYYQAQPKPSFMLYSSFMNLLPGAAKPVNLMSFQAELISPASERQIQRAMPSPKTRMVQETPEMYASITKPFIQGIVESGSLSWIENIVTGRKEQERLLLDTPDYILNIDTKWRSHPDPAAVDRSEWYNHKATQDLYCLAIAKDSSIKSLRDLRATHIPMLKSILQNCPKTIEQIYGVPEDQLRIFVHYHPQFYHFHVHFTRLENEVGCQVERGHLLSDIVQNLQLDSNFYERRTLTYRMRESDKLYQLIHATRNND